MESHEEKLHKLIVASKVRNMKECGGSLFGCAFGVAAATGSNETAAAGCCAREQANAVWCRVCGARGLLLDLHARTDKLPAAYLLADSATVG